MKGSVRRGKLDLPDPNQQEWLLTVSGSWRCKSDRFQCRQQFKAGGVSGAFDDFDGPVAKSGEGVTQVGAVIDAVGEEMAQPRKQLVDGLDHQHGTIAILDIGGMHLGTDQQTASIGHNVALAAPSLRCGAGF